MKPNFYEKLLFNIVVMIAREKCVLSFKCLDWTSSLDGKYRSHCYEYHQEAYISTFEAEKMCKNTSGQLAPYIDEFQYEFWETFLQIPNRREIIIGVNDLVQEGVWTSFDGTPVSNLPWNPGQPNRGRDQNCVVINRQPPGCGVPFKLQDKECSSAFEGFLCYKDAMCFTDPDLNFVTNCFWFISDKVGWTFHEANDQCKEQDGVLASVTSLEQFDFLKSTLQNFTAYTGLNTTWLGVLFIDSQYRNVNGDDFPVGVFYLDPPEESCLQLVAFDSSQYAGDPSLFRSCHSGKSMAGICTKSKRGHRWYTEKNSTSDAYIRNVLKIDKSKTAMDVLKHSSVFDGRTSSTGIGIVGVSVILAVMTFMVVLDCGQRQKIDKQKKRKKPNNRMEHYPTKLRVKNKISTTQV